MRVVSSALVVLLLVVVLGTGLLAFFQRRLLYYPSRTAMPEARAAASRLGLSEWRGPGGELRGWRAPSAHATGAALVLHGNAGTALDRFRYLEALAPLGVEPVLLEYPGYGPRPGTPSLHSLTGAAVDAMEALAAEGKPVWLVGESLGTGVAARATRERPDLVKGLLLVTPFADLAAVARHHFTLLPSLILLDRYTPARDLRGFRGPVVILLAGQDEVVTAAEGHRLFAAISGPKRLFEQPEATHNGFDLSPRLPFWRESAQFLGMVDAQAARE